MPKYLQKLQNSVILKKIKGGKLMNNGEFYKSNETSKINEYKYFPAEEYRRRFEENQSGKEEARSGKEITTLQKRKSERKSNSDITPKTLIDKIFNSVKTIATTATVAVASVVVTTTLIVNAPKVDLKSIDTGYDYVEYEMEISDLDKESKYSIVVSTSNEDNVEFEVEENGVYKNRVECLKPEWEYTLSLVCHDTALGDVTHFEIKFQTLKYEEQQPIPPPGPTPPPDTYTGNFTLPSASEITVNWNEMTLALPIQFENIENKYYYNLIAIDQNGEIIYTEPAKNDKAVIVPIIDGKTEYSFTFEIYGVGEKEEKLISTPSIGKIDLVKPSVDIKDILISGENQIKVYFDTQNASDIDFIITYPDKTEETAKLTNKEISQGYVSINVKDTALSVDITPIINLDGYTLTEEITKKVFENNLEIETLVDLQTEGVSFFLKYIGNGSDRVKVISSLDPENPTDEYIYDGKVMVFYYENTSITYTLYLTNENGDILSNQVEITVDTSKEISEEYLFHYVNPGDVVVTYNDDKTINAVVPLTFETESLDIYCKVVLGRYIYNCNESMLIATGLENKSYSLSYYICKDIDGISYSFYTLVPSGMVNEMYISDAVTTEQNGNEVTVSLWENLNFDLDSIILISSSGEETSLTQSDFIYDSEYYEYKSTVVFETEFDYVTVKGRCSPFKEKTEALEIEYLGSIYQEFELTFNNEGE